MIGSSADNCIDSLKQFAIIINMNNDNTINSCLPTIILCNSDCHCSFRRQFEF